MIARLDKYSSLDLTLEHTPEDLVKNHYIDACKLFVKTEAHKIDKIKEQRFRLIFSMSIVDNLIAFLLFNNQNKEEILNWSTIPSQPGIGFSDTQIHAFTRAVKETFGEDDILETDVRHWDFSVKPEDYDFDLFRRLILNDGFGTVWHTLARAHYYCVQRQPVTTSDGEVYAFVLPGIMRSGWGNTSSANSAIRWGSILRCMYFLGILESNVKTGKTNGDDCVEKKFAEPDVVASLYLRQGKKVKNVAIRSANDFEFCSFRWVNGIAYPVNLDKQLFNYLNSPPRDEFDLKERENQLFSLHRFSPYLEEIKSLLKEVKWNERCLSLPSRAKLLAEQVDIGSEDFEIQNTLCVLSEKPRDCTDSSIIFHSRSEYLQMNSPLSHRVSNTMTKKTKTKRRVRAKPGNRTKQAAQAAHIAQLQNQVAQLKVSGGVANGPWARAGAAVGGIAGSYIPLPGASKIGAGFGRWLGSGIGIITGSGDYKMVGPAPTYNVLAGNPPKFSSTYATNIVCHREYLGDISGTTNFTNLQYPLNPGMSTTFPWLSQIAANYQQYRFHGLVFEFRPLITDFVTSGAPGVVVMATNYNADQTAYASRQIMENSEFAVSVKPTNALMHMVECNPDQTAMKLYNIRTTALPNNQDLRLSDLGLFQFATQSNPNNQNLGELWCTYCVEFFKPVMAIENSVVEAVATHFTRNNIANNVPMGTTTTSAAGSLLISNITNTAITIAGLNVTGNYEFIFTWIGTGGVTFVAPSVSVSGGKLNTWNQTASGPDTTTQISTIGTTVTAGSLTFFAQATATSMTITLGAGGTLPTGTPLLEVYIASVDPVVNL